MNIASVKKVEDCFDGGSVFSYEMDEEVTEASIKRLGVLGRLDYFPHFPRPFYRLITDDGLQIKGVEGERDFQVIFPRKEKEKIKEEFERFITTHN